VSISTGRKDLNQMKSLLARIRAHPFVSLILSVLFIAAVFTRVHLLGRSLWLDEAWIANAVLAPSLREAIYYDAWLQTAPPFFIVLTRLALLLFGISNATLRIVPALSGIASAILISFIALKLLKPIFAIIAVSLFVFCPDIILYSQSLKQYSTDVLCAVALLALALFHLEKRSGRSFYLAITGFVVLAFLSYPAILFLPFLLYCAMVGVGDEKSGERSKKLIGPKWSQALLVAAAGIFVSATNYLFFISPNESPALFEYWSDGFYQGDGLAGLVVFYASRFPTLTGLFFFNNPGFLEVGLFAVTLVGLGSLSVRGIRQSGIYLSQAVLFMTPIAGVIALNLLRIYPVPTFDHRLLLFAFPITDLMFCLGFQALAHGSAVLIASWIKQLKVQTVENTLGALGFIVLVGLLLLFFHLDGLGLFFAVEREQAQEAVGYLAQRVQPDDVLYVHASMGEQFKFYERLTPPAANRVVHGSVGFPCCPRKGYRDPRRESIRIVAEEIFELGALAAGRSLWFLVTDRISQWRILRRNDIEMFEFGLAKSGCKKIDGIEFVGVRIDRFECKSS
jgi:hypothetical protein